MLEHELAVAVHVIAVEDPVAALLEELPKSRLAFVQLLAPAIFTVDLEHVERVEHDALIVQLRVQLVEDREALLVADDAFAIEQDGFDAQLAHTADDQRKALGPVNAAPRVDAHAIAGLP